MAGKFYLIAFSSDMSKYVSFCILRAYVLQWKKNKKLDSQEGILVPSDGQVGHSGNSSVVHLSSFRGADCVRYLCLSPCLANRMFHVDATASVTYSAQRPLQFWGLQKRSCSMGPGLGVREKKRKTWISACFATQKKNAVPNYTKW